MLLLLRTPGSSRGSAQLAFAKRAIVLLVARDVHAPRQPDNEREFRNFPVT